VLLALLLSSARTDKIDRDDAPPQQPRATRGGKPDGRSALLSSSLSSTLPRKKKRK
jgi:hypothetical protein